MTASLTDQLELIKVILLEIETDWGFINHNNPEVLKNWIPSSLSESISYLWRSSIFCIV